jgi:hypothetical protein
VDERELITAKGGLPVEDDYPASAWDAPPPAPEPAPVPDVVPGQLSMFAEKMVRAGLRPNLATEWSAKPEPAPLSWIRGTARKRARR